MPSSLSTSTLLNEGTNFRFKVPFQFDYEQHNKQRWKKDWLDRYHTVKTTSSSFSKKDSMSFSKLKAKHSTQVCTRYFEQIPNLDATPVPSDPGKVSCTVNRPLLLGTEFASSISQLTESSTLSSDVAMTWSVVSSVVSSCISKLTLSMLVMNMSFEKYIMNVAFRWNT